MNTYLIVMFFQKVQIWRDIVCAYNPPELLDLNKQLNLFGDSLFVKQLKTDLLLYEI